MAQAVIDGLESIEINEKNREGVLGVPSPSTDHPLETVREECSVRELRQGIVKRIVQQPLSCAPEARAHVVERRRQHRRFRASHDRYLTRPVPGSNVLRGACHFSEGSARPAAEDDTRGHGERKRHEAAKKQTSSQFVQKLLRRTPVLQQDEPADTARWPVSKQ